MQTHADLSSLINANVSGVAVLGDMFITTGFIALIMVMLWQTALVFVLTFLVIIRHVKLQYLSISSPFKSAPRSLGSSPSNHMSGHCHVYLVLWYSSDLPDKESQWIICLS